MLPNTAFIHYLSLGVRELAISMVYLLVILHMFGGVFSERRIWIKTDQGEE